MVDVGCSRVCSRPFGEPTARCRRTGCQSTSAVTFHLPMYIGTGLAAGTPLACRLARQRGRAALADASTPPGPSQGQGAGGWIVPKQLAAPMGLIEPSRRPVQDSLPGGGATWPYVRLDAQVPKIRSPNLEPVETVHVGPGNVPSGLHSITSWTSSETQHVAIMTGFEQRQSLLLAHPFPAHLKPLLLRLCGIETHWTLFSSRETQA